MALVGAAEWKLDGGDDWLLQWLLIGTAGGQWNAGSLDDCLDYLLALLRGQRKVERMVD